MIHIRIHLADENSKVYHPRFLEEVFVELKEAGVLHPGDVIGILEDYDALKDMRCMNPLIITSEEDVSSDDTSEVHDSDPNNG